MKEIVNSNQTHTQAARKLGESLRTQGFFEIDFIDGCITWANQFALVKMGYSIEQITTLSIFNIIPEEFHEYARNSMSNKQSGNYSHYEMWPFLSSNREIIWWYTTEINHEDSRIWLKSEYLNKTLQSGPEMNLMIITLNTVQAYNELVLRIEKQEVKIDQLEHKNLEHNKIIHDINTKLGTIEGIARSAADSSFQNSENLKKFSETFNKALDEQTAEILRLIMTNAVHDERMKQFNKVLQEAAEKTTTTAIGKITEQSEHAGKQMIKRVDEAGSKASRRITIPLGLLVLIATFVQIFIQLIKH